MAIQIRTILIFFILILPIISAAPPVSQIQQFEQGYTIIGTPIEYIKLNENFTYNFFVYNISNGISLTNSSINCMFYMSDSQGNLIYNEYSDYASKGYFLNSIDKDIFNTTGYYPFGIKCNSSDFGGTFVSYFMVTPEGNAPENNSFAIILGISLIMLSLLLISYFWENAHWMIKTMLIMFALYLGSIEASIISNLAKSHESLMKMLSSFNVMEIMMIVMIWVIVAYIMILITINIFKSFSEARNMSLVGKWANVNQ